MANCATLWTLHRDGCAIAAEVWFGNDEFGLELRYIRDGATFAWLRYRDGADLLNEAETERFDLEARGWRLGASPPSQSQAAAV
jgi:hypothetical protein